MDILKKGEYTGDIISSFEIDGSIITNTHYSIKKNNPEWHYHENLHICFVFQGGKADTLKESRYTEKKGSIFFYHAEEKHRWVSTEIVSKSANIEISSAFLKMYDLPEYDVKLAIQNNIDAKTIILKIQQELLINSKASRPHVKSLLLELVSKSKSLNNKDLPQWIKLLIELLNDRWDEQLSLNEMSEIVGVHPVTISKFFRKYFSYTLGEYQRKLKIDKSIELIKNTQMSLSEIAFCCGFTDQSHFIRNFKIMTGFLPSHFRKF